MQEKVPFSLFIQMVYVEQQVYLSTLSRDLLLNYISLLLCILLRKSKHQSHLNLAVKEAYFNYLQIKVV